MPKDAGAMLLGLGEQRFGEMIDALPTAIYTTDAEGRLTYFNPAAARLSGRAPEVGTDQWCVTWKIFMPDGTYVPHDQCPMAAALKGLPVDTGGEYMAERPDGSRFWFSPFPTALRDGNGRIVGGINMLVDITERKRSQEALRRSEERFRGFFKSSAIGVAILSLDARFLEVNRAFCSITGYAEEELCALDCARLTHPDDYGPIRELIGQLTAGEIPTFAVESRYFTKDGRTLWVNNSVSLMRDQRGRPEYLIAACEDITARKRAENDLRETEERLRAIIETTPECIKVVARDGTLLHMNSVGLGMVQAARPEDVEGKSVYDVIAPEFRDAFRAFNERICRGERGSLEFDIIGLKGLRRHMESYAAPLHRQDGTIAHLAITHDITERNRRERAALLLSAIVDSSDDAIISKDLNGIITSWNKSAERVFGYTSEEVVGKSVTILIPADRQDEEPHILSRLRRGERVDHFETIRRRKDGTLLDISLTISPVKDAAGRVIGASKIARDITDRKRVEADLIASEARFRQLADSMPQMVWTARPDGYIDYFNERWYDYTGFSRDTFGDASWKPILHPEDAERCFEAWYSAVRAGQPYSIEHRFWDRQAKCWRWFVSRALPVRDNDGAVVKWFGASTDIDEQKRVEDELRRANQDLEQFAYSASHDLQEPLRSIKIYGELLTTRYAHRLDGQALEFLGYLHTGATRMELLVRDLLAYTQVGRLDPPAEDVDANEVLTATIDALSGAIIQSDATVTGDSMPAVRVHATHLKQLFQNLIGNAIKYRSKERAPVVHVSAERQSGFCRFSVRDNGIGIDPEYKEHIFGLFKRLHSGDEYSGTGIGLAICQRIVERYHGRIWVESELGNGSEFIFVLPASGASLERNSVQNGRVERSS
jgi:PAS domain S-box-containing protein